MGCTSSACLPLLPLHEGGAYEPRLLFSVGAAGK